MSNPAGYRKYSGRILFVLSLVATCTFVWIFAQVTTHIFAKQDATAAGQIVERYFRLDIDEIEAIAQGAKPSDNFKATIDRGLNAQVFFGYKIFDAQGRLRYAASANAGSNATTPYSDVIDPVAARAAAQKSAITETGETIVASQVRYLADTVIPVLRNGKTVAVQEIYLEQTDRLNQLRDRITILTLLAALLAAIAFGIPAIAWRRKSAALAEHEKELELQSQRFATALDTLPQGVTMFDGERKLAVANTAYAEIFGLKPEAMKPGTAADDVRRLRLETGTRVLSDFEKETIPLLSNGIEHANEVWKLPNGSVVRTFRYPVPGGGWVSLHEDVTEELKHQEELHTARRFLDTVVENIPGAIIVKDAATLRYQLANKH